jgi:HK97 family phage major capsid protein
MQDNALRLLAVAVVIALMAAGVFPDPALAGALGTLPFLVGDTKDMDQVLKVFEDFKKANDERLKQIEEKGRADPLLEEKVTKANEAVDKVIKAAEENARKLVLVETELKTEKARGDTIEATLQRLNKGAAGGGQIIQVKAEHLAEYQSVYGEVNEAQYLEHKSALKQFMRKGDHSKLDGFQAKAMSVDSNADGGYWVMPDTSGRVVSKIFETSPMRQFAAVQAITTDALEGTYDLDEAAFGWVAESGSRTETASPQTGQWRIPAHEMYAMPKATQKLLDDSSVDPEAWLANKVSNRFSRGEAAAFVNGSGVTQPRGFLTYAHGVPTKGAWKVVEQTATGVSADFAAADKADIFLTVMGKLKEFYMPGAIWAMNRTTKAAVRKLKSGDGNYLLAIDWSQGVRETILGLRVVGFEDMPSYNVADALAIALANFGEGYQIVDRQGIRVLRDPFTSKPFVLFYTTRRVGGDVINHEAIKLVKFGVSV